MKALVECTLKVEVDIGTFDGDEDDLRYLIEGHWCPGTGSVGAAIDAVIEKHNATSTCWACALSGNNKLLKVVEEASNGEGNRSGEAKTDEAKG